MLNYITELFVFVDNFLKLYISTQIGNQMYLINWKNKRGFNKKLSLSEVVTLNIIRFYFHIDDLKSFHKLAKNEMTKYFPEIPNYENFLKSTNKSLGFILVILNYLLHKNRLPSSKYHFIDSTDLPVCKNYNIFNHKVTAGVSDRGKTTKGWFYGIKLHGVCNVSGDLENVFFTSGNVHDNQVLHELLENISGIFVCDSGYLLKEEDLNDFIKLNKEFFIATRKNMKRLMTKEQKQLFRKRSRIETDWSVLKERFNVVYSLARSLFGLLRHYIYSLISFMIKDSKSDLILLNHNNKNILYIN
jgi:hypothetical protein